MRATPLDYDSDPQRFRTVRRNARRYGGGEVFPLVAARFGAAPPGPILDVGCGEGELARHLPAGARWIGLDGSPTMLAAAPPLRVRGDAVRLPVADGSCGAVAMLYMLYHLADPAAAVAEAHRVLRRGGVVAACAPSREDSPELAHLIPWRPSTCSAETIPDLLAARFVDVDVVAWDAPLVRLPSADAIADYLYGRGTPRAAAVRAAESLEVPLTVTKRGAVVFARRV